jgi:hypothetical protein
MAAWQRSASDTNVSATDRMVGTTSSTALINEKMHVDVRAWMAQILRHFCGALLWGQEMAFLRPPM